LGLPAFCVEVPHLSVFTINLLTFYRNENGEHFNVRWVIGFICLAHLVCVKLGETITSRDLPDKSPVKRQLDWVFYC